MQKHDSFVGTVVIGPIFFGNGLSFYLLNLKYLT